MLCDLRGESPAGTRRSPPLEEDPQGSQQNRRGQDAESDGDDTRGTEATFREAENFRR